MALMKCPECGKRISTYAHMCPDCGYPMPNHEQVASIGNEKTDMINANHVEEQERATVYAPLENPIQYVPYKKRSCVIPVVIVLVGFLVMFMLTIDPSHTSPSILIVGICIVFTGILYGSYIQASNNEREQKNINGARITLMQNRMEWLEQNHIQVSCHISNGSVIVDLAEKQELLLIDQTVITFGCIIGCELIFDSTTTSQRDGAIGRAVLGGIIAGGAGAIVGANTASTTQTTVTNIKGVSIYTNYINNSRVDIVTSAEESRNIYSTVLAIIDRNKQRQF